MLTLVQRGTLQRGYVTSATCSQQPSEAEFEIYPQVLFAGHVYLCWVSYTRQEAKSTHASDEDIY